MTEPTTILSPDEEAVKDPYGFTIEWAVVEGASMCILEIENDTDERGNVSKLPDGVAPFELPAGAEFKTALIAVGANDNVLQDKVEYSIGESSLPECWLGG